MKEMKIKALIIDDEPLAREYIRWLLKDDKQIEIIADARNGREALKLIIRNQPDLLFLDIQMPEMDGFTLLENLDQNQIPAIVFTTAYEEFAIRAFEYHALDYLLKPFDQSRFDRAVDYAKQLLSDRNLKKQGLEQIQLMLEQAKKNPKYLERILIKKQGRIDFLKTEDIDWIKADDKYIHLYNGKSSYMIRQSLSEILNQLDPQTFIQANRSVIINIEQIKKMQKMFKGTYVIILKDGTEIELSPRYKNQLFDLLGNPF